MRTVQPLICSLALLAVFLTGCETTHKVQNVDKPTARMVSLGLQEVESGYATVLFDVEIDNPCGVSLSLVNLSYSLTSGGNTFVTATPARQTAVPPNSRQIVTLPDEVIYARLLRALNSKAGSTITYKARLWLQVDVPSLGSIELPMANAGRLKLPGAPEIKMQDKRYNAVDKADVVTLYLNPAPDAKLAPQLEKLEGSSGIVSDSFGVGAVKPDKVVRLTCKEDSNKHTIYLWTAPLGKDKKKGNCRRCSFFQWTLGRRAVRFMACKAPISEVNRLRWMVWPLCADI
jgi:LEA14-like dessication related protein